MLSGRARLQAYSLAGSDFLADRIADMFQVIETKEQQALHNVILEEVMSMIGDDTETRKMFFRCIAHKMLAQKRKTFINYVVESIKLIGKG